MPSPSLFPLVDTIYRGHLAEVLKDARRRGLSYQAIADEIAGRTRTVITGQTIRRWCRDLDIEAKAAS